MGIFTQLVLSFEFRPDVPREVLGSLASVAHDPTEALPEPPERRIQLDDLYDSIQEPFWQYDWGPFLGSDLSGVRGGICGAVLAQKSLRRPGSWTLTARAVLKGLPEDVVEPAFLWLGRYACPYAAEDLRELVGYMKTEASDRPVLIWHDGNDFVLEDLNPNPGEYR